MSEEVKESTNGGSEFDLGCGTLYLNEREKNFDIPPNGYIYILSTSTLKIMAHKKCPNSWSTIKDINNMKGIKAPIKSAIRVKAKNKGLI